MPSPLDLADLPFLREALAEVVLLAAAGGLLSAWIVLRRLAFFSHAVGSATLPGPRGRRRLRGQPAARGAGRRARLRRRRRARRARRARAERGDGAAARGRARRRRGARQRRVRVRRRRRPAAVRHAARPRDRRPGAVRGDGGAGRRSARSRSGRTWSAIAFDPDGAPALGLPAARADFLLLALVAVAAVAAIPAVGALLVAAVYVLPGAAARLVARTIPALLAWSVALALAEGLLGLYAAYWLDLPPGPPGGGARRRSPTPCSRSATARPAPGSGAGVTAACVAEDLAAGYGGRPVLREVSFAADARPDRLRARPQRRRQDHAVPRPDRRARAAGGRVELSGRPAYVAQTERTRLDFPVSALDVALMGALAHGRWWLPPRRADRAAARGGAGARRAGRARPTRPSASSPAASASAPCSRARSCRTRRCCCSTSRSPASTRPARS